MPGPASLFKRRTAEHTGCVKLKPISVVAALASLAGMPLVAAEPIPAPGRFKIPRAEVAGFLPPRLDPAKVAVGERLFLETRFSQFFFARSKGDVNATLAGAILSLRPHEQRASRCPARSATSPSTVAPAIW